MTTIPETADKKLADRYRRIAGQLDELYVKIADPVSRMGSAAALLHHKMPHFFWTGFYRLVDEDLIVGPYQGPLACMLLERHAGVCWAAIDRGESMLVPDVHAFPGHIACDSRSNSEVVVLLRDGAGEVRSVLDVDSRTPDAFTSADVEGLERIAAMICAPV
ncbi:MAG: GAF domain-containing protein [Acidobacteria bacterium]|nr:GAF domain-containing protein [Acidobacteriota bacterium]